MTAPVLIALAVAGDAAAWTAAGGTVVDDGGCGVGRLRAQHGHGGAGGQARARPRGRLSRPVWGMGAEGGRHEGEKAAAGRGAGFSKGEIQAFSAPLPIGSPHIAGAATK